MAKSCQSTVRETENERGKPSNLNELFIWCAIIVCGALLDETNNVKQFAFLSIGNSEEKRAKKKIVSSVYSFAFITKCLKTFKFYCLSISFTASRVIRLFEMCRCRWLWYYSSENIPFFNVRLQKSRTHTICIALLIWVILSLRWPFYVF